MTGSAEVHGGRLAGRVAFVTSGGGGIGAACARRLAVEGAAVGVADRDLRAAEQVVATIPGAVALAVDVADGGSVDAALSALVAAAGRLDVAVNCAGIGGPNVRLHEYTSADWRTVVGVDLDGVFECMRAELVVMLPAASGSIVNVSSILGSSGWATASAYTAAKHGVEGLTKAAALEYARDGIRVNAVAPGFIGTDLIRTRMAPADLAALDGKHPIGRIGETDEVAAVVAFLASDEASFVTGSSYRVDGGYLSVAGLG